MYTGNPRTVVDKKYDTSRGQLNTLQMPVSVIWEHVRENTFLSKLCIGSKLFYTVKNWPSSFFNNVNLRLTVFSFTSAKLVLQQSHYAKLKKYWIIYLESYVFANSLSRNIFREIAKKKKGIEKFKASVNYGWDKNTSWNWFIETTSWMRTSTN